MKPRKYRIKDKPVMGSDIGQNQDKGDIVYDLLRHDYGLANDDSRATGILHKSVTLDPTGDYPSFTVPAHNLEEIHD